MKQPWFSATSFGYWPARWQAWLITGIVLALIALDTYAIYQTTPFLGDTLITLFPFAFTVLVLWLFIAYVKGEKHLWFRNKLYGWGWTPVTWQGWLVVALAVAAVAFTLTIAESEMDSTLYVLTNIVPAIVLLVLITTLVSYKTGEKPRWRWGKDT